MSRVLLPFVARAGVLADIDAVFGAAQMSRGTLLMVTGEPGIGKSRLIQEAAAQADGFEVVWIWFPPAGTGGALRPWARVLRALAGADATAARLVRASPYLSGLVTGGSRTGRDDPEGARWQLSVDLAELVGTAAARQPLLVVIDDLHEADLSSLQLLAELAPSLRRSRWSCSPAHATATTHGTTGSPPALRSHGSVPAFRCGLSVRTTWRPW